MGRLDEAVAEYHVAIAASRDADTINGGSRWRRRAVQDSRRTARPSRIGRNTGTRSATWPTRTFARDLAKAAVAIYPEVRPDERADRPFGNVLHAGRDEGRVGRTRSPSGEQEITQTTWVSYCRRSGMFRAVEAYGVALKVDPTYAIAHYSGRGLAVATKVG